MSSYEFATDRHTIRIGWDNPLETFFAQVWLKPEPEDDEDPLLWVGVRVQEVPTVEDLAAHLEPYAEIPEGIAASLRQDHGHSTPPTALQRQLRR